MPVDRLILLAHGSPDSRWRRPFEELAESLGPVAGSSAVRLAFMQLATPLLADVVAEASRDGVCRLKVLPLFLAPGAHVERDIPEQVREARARHPQIHIQLLSLVGADPRMASLLRTLALEAVSATPVP